MDNPVDGSPCGATPHGDTAYVPDRRATLACAAGTVIAVGATVLATDTVGRAVAALVALVLAGYTVSDLVFRPRLLLTATGIAVRSPFWRGTLAWSQVESIRADVRSRGGLRSASLEVDAGETLIVFSRRALGADPADVAVVAAGYRGPS